MKIALNALLALGMILLPFSTSGDEGSFVFNFGLPFLFAFAFASLASQVRHWFTVPCELAALVMICILATVWIVATSLISPSPLPSLGRAAVHVTGLFLFLHFISLAREPQNERSVQFHRWAGVMLLSGAIMAAYYAWVFGWAISERGIIEVLSERWVGGGYSLPWGASNNLAAALLLPLAAGLALAHARALGKWRGLGIGIVTLGILLSLSRNALACALLALIGFSLVSGRVVPVLVSLVAAFGAAFAAETYEPGMLQEVIGMRFGDLYGLQNLNHRFEIWANLLPQAGGYLLWPVGFYGSLSAFDETSAHNAILTTALEQGLVGLLLSALLFLEVLRQLRVRKPQDGIYGARVRATLLIGVLVVMLNLQFEDPHFTYPYIIYAWFYLGLIVLAARGVQVPSRVPSPRGPQLTYA